MSHPFSLHISILSLFRYRRHIKLPLHAAEFLPITWRENAIVTDTDKPVRQYVLRKKIQERIDAFGLDLMFAATSIVLVIVGNCIVSHVHYSGICNGHTISITSDVLQDLTDSLGRRL